MNVVVPFAIRKAGGRIELARKLSISPQAISQWKEIPTRQVLAIETITGISRFDLRPDIFGASRGGFLSTTCTQDGTWIARCHRSGVTATGSTIDDALAELRRLLAASEAA